MTDTRIYVDFNDIQDGKLSALTKHAEDPSSLVTGEHVLLLDDDGNSALGRIDGFESNGIVQISMVRGSWRDRHHPIAPGPAELKRFLDAYASSGVRSFDDAYQLSVVRAAAATAAPTFVWRPAVEALPGAVPSSM